MKKLKTSSPLVVPLTFSDVSGRSLLLGRFFYLKIGMATLLDLTGQRFGSWLVLKPAEKSKHGKSRFLCICDCGNEKEVVGSNMVSGISTKCRECSDKEHQIHGDHSTGFYQCWSDIKQRCLNPVCAEYKNYGGRGITVCEDWQENYLNFKRDMSEGYSPDLRIERIDNNKGYYKENCRWATHKDQCRNMRKNRYIDTPSGNMLLVEAAEKYGVKASIIRFRLQRGVPTELLLHPGRFPWNFFKNLIC